jgi:hypothetical protein
MRRLVLALSAVSILACGDSSGPEFSSAVGTWNLVTVNGSALPFTLDFSQAYRLELLSDVFVASEDGTWTETTTLRETDNGTATTTTEQGNGTWTQTGNTVTVTESGGGTETNTATISGNTITLTQGQGFVAVYHRQ